MRLSFSHRFAVIALLVAPPVLLAACAVPSQKESTPVETDLDRLLAGHEGTVVLIDPSTGVIRGISNPRLAFEQAFPAGSAIKPFTLLAAMRAGITTPESRRQCSGGYWSREYRVACSHRKSISPFGPTEALAYSCNDYFGHIGDRLGESAFLSTLEAFGFGKRTGVNGSNESSGVLRSGDWGPSKSIGESDTLLVTPIQLLVAYSAIFNGGKVIRPAIGSDGETVSSPKLSASLEIPQRGVELLRQAMQSSLKIGTASEVGFDTNQLTVFGKTGTSTSSNGWRTQGWFVGFAGESKKPDVGIVVLLKRATGRDAARVAASVLNAFGQNLIQSSVDEAKAVRKTRQIKVKTTGDHRILQLSLERYLEGVLIAEYSVEDGVEALKAHAVASRSYALANLGRHGSEGFDFCSTTHCQRFAVDPPAGDQRRAVSETSEIVLVDQHGDPVEAFFHADCGGSTTSATALWGRGGRPYLRPVEDKFCEARAPEWTDRISSSALAAAFTREPRSNTGDILTDIRVSARDSTGRAEWITLRGRGTKRIRGWEFKMIAGRSLGWNVIKSSHFDVWREGRDFVFRGRGHGHGLGMCQAGAGAMASSGASYRKILNHYFPGTSISEYKDGLSQRSLASEHFRVYFTTATAEDDVHRALEVLESGYNDAVRRLESASIPFPLANRVDLTVSASTSSYIASTGMPGWTAAITRSGKIITQPLRLLNERGVFVTALRHELAHVVIEVLSKGTAERWLAEGLSSHFAGEGPLLSGGDSTSLSLDELERRITSPRSAAEMKSLYRQAYLEVRSRIRSRGEPEVWRHLAQKAKKESVQSVPPD